MGRGGREKERRFAFTGSLLKWPLEPALTICDPVHYYYVRIFEKVCGKWDSKVYSDEKNILKFICMRSPPKFIKKMDTNF